MPDTQVATGSLYVPTNNDPRDRVDLRADPKWIARATRQAHRFGMGLSAYIRLAVTERMEQDEQDEAQMGGKRRRKSES
jgi:hypothetical protein